MAEDFDLLAGLAKDASLGTDGADPPPIAGTGMRGWLRAVYERLLGTLTVQGVVMVANPTPAVETGLAKDVTLVQVRDRLPASAHDQPLTELQLRDSDVAVADDYEMDRITSDQAGADAVLLFPLGGPAVLVAVDVDPVDLQDPLNYLCRATVDGSSPTAARGWRCRSGGTTYLPVPCPSGTVRVYAPVGVTVSVQAGARA